MPTPRLVGAVYSRCDLLLLVHGYNDPDSIDVSRAPHGIEPDDSDDAPQPTYRETYGVDPIPASVSIADLFAQLKAEIAKERGVRKVVETTGVELREAG